MHKNTYEETCTHKHAHTHTYTQTHTHTHTYGERKRCARERAIACKQCQECCVCCLFLVTHSYVQFLSSFLLPRPGGERIKGLWCVMKRICACWSSITSRYFSTCPCNFMDGRFFRITRLNPLLRQLLSLKVNALCSCRPPRAAAVAAQESTWLFRCRRLRPTSARAVPTQERGGCILREWGGLSRSRESKKFLLESLAGFEDAVAWRGR